MSVQAILQVLQAEADPVNVAGLQRFGIRSSVMLGVPKPVLHGIARQYRRDHALALKLWATGVLEARIVAGLIDDPKQVTDEQMEAWVRDFDSWDLCDQVTGKLFDKTPMAWEKSIAWCREEPEFVRRAGFAMMAWLAIHDKKAADERYYPFLEEIGQGAGDERNFVWKAANWALRNIGKRNLRLNAAAIACAEGILEQYTRSSRWIARDALRELTSEKVQARVLARG